ncbi:uncharacterized protein LOC143285598 [Babylonia areolata]|uniref:uncharacterized protein LOC143285598 n=1 Tax=Babylonia areolata TaxID=304850 RepID=UPI003FD48417
MEGSLLPQGLNMSSLMALIHNLTPEAQQALFTKLGWTSGHRLRQLVEEGALSPVHDDWTLYPEYRARKLLRLYVPPILLVLGTFGNICSFIILRHKAMARQSTHHFLAALAVLDSCVLLVGLFRQWLGELTGSDLKNQGPWLCKTIVVLGYTCSNVAVWIIVAVTVERYIVVCHPLKASRVCNVARAKRVVVGFVMLFLCINLHFLWTAGLSRKERDGVEGERGAGTGGGGEDGHRGEEEAGGGLCSSQEGHDFIISAVWPWVDALLYGFSPFLIIFSLNIVIIVHLVRATSATTTTPNCLTVPGSCHAGSSNSNNSRSRGRTGKSSSLHVLATHRRLTTATSSTTSSSLRMTVMLLTVSFTFLLTTFPMNVCVIASAFWNQQPGDAAHMARFQLVFTVAELLMYVNHSVNFFLYCAAGHKFRSEMRRIVCGRNSRSGGLSFDHSHHIYCSRNCVNEGFSEIPNDETGL